MNCNSPSAELRVTLPLPPSFNKAWRAFAFLAKGRPKARVILSEEARRWYVKAAAVLARVPKVPALAAPTAVLEVHLTVYVPTLASDCTNRVKLVEDALTKARHVHDDRAHVEVHVLKHVDGEHPRVEVVVREAPAERHADVVQRLDRAAQAAVKREEKKKQGLLPSPPSRRRRGAPRALAAAATPNIRKPGGAP